MGGRLAFGLAEISHDPRSLDKGGFWAVSATFEGEWTCARFETVIDSQFPDRGANWRGVSGTWSSTLSQKEYQNYVEEIRDEIAHGNVYQVNACRELTTSLENQSLVGLMSQLLKENPAPYACYLKLPTIEIASASPEFARSQASRHTLSCSG